MADDPLTAAAEPVESYNAETEDTTFIACTRVIRCGHVWTDVHLVAYRQSGLQHNCQHCQVALFEVPPSQD